MIPLDLGTYPKSDIRPPKIRHNGLPFDKPKFADEDAEKLADHFGYKCLSGPDYANVWLYVSKYVVPHQDSSGRCMVYLYSGKGYLNVVDKGKIIETKMNPGKVVVFNDRQNHFWLSEKPCTMLVCSVKKPT
jgi:hypothetical protein